MLAPSGNIGLLALVYTTCLKGGYDCGRSKPLPYLAFDSFLTKFKMTRKPPVGEFLDAPV